MNLLLKICIIYLSILVPTQASVYYWDGKNNIVGKKIVSEYFSPTNNNAHLHDLGMSSGIGYYEMLLANSHIEKPKTIKNGTKIIYPSHYILPNAKHEGIVINLSELRLYLFKPKENMVITFPIGIGKAISQTPTHKGHVTGKLHLPTWYIPKEIIEEMKEAGIENPPSNIPPGELNPLGKHAIILSLKGYLIHGTNLTKGVGMQVTHGCIRLTPRDIELLYNEVKVGMPVAIINQPLKIAKSGNQYFIESHIPFYKNQNKSIIKKTILEQTGLTDADFAWNEVFDTVLNYNGYPEVINKINSQ